MRTTLTIVLLAGFSSVAHGATQLKAYPQAVTVPVGMTQSCTAEVQGVNDKTVTWAVSPSGPALVGSNPSILNEPSTIGVKSTTKGTFTVTATSRDGTASQGCTITYTDAPTPATTQPHLGGMTSSNLAALKAKAVAGNTLYQTADYQVAVGYYGNMSGWALTCNGGNGQPSSDQTESYGELYAFRFAHLALLDPSNATYKWGCAGRDIMTYMMMFWLQPLNTSYDPSSLPYRQTEGNYGLTGNHGSDSTAELSVTPDWLLGSLVNGAAGTSWLSAGSGGHLTATVTGTTMNLPTVSAGGTGYNANSAEYWIATGGGCTKIADFGNAFSSLDSQNNGTPIVAWGTVRTNGSGQLGGTVTVLGNALNCASPPSFTVLSDQDILHRYLAMAGQQMIVIALTGSRAVVGGYNSSAQYDTGSLWDFGGQRAFGNNYTHSKEAYLTAVALTFNDTTSDDPVLPNTCSATRYQVCPDGTAGSLHAYFTYFAGGVFYKDYAHLEDPAVSWAAYQAAYGNLPSKPQCDASTSTTLAVRRVDCFGDARHGESQEGSWYQYSMYRTALACVNLQSAGYLDPVKYGPQMGLCTMSWWDLKVNHDLAMLTYSHVPSQPRYAYITTGDSLSQDRAPSDFQTFAWWMVYDAMTGRTDRTAKLEWPLIYTSQGGIAAFYNNLGNAYGSMNTIPLFIALPSGDPTTSPPADPRGALLTDTFSFNNQHIQVRSGWVDGGPISPATTQSWLRSWGEELAARNVGTNMQGIKGLPPRPFWAHDLAQRAPRVPRQQPRASTQEIFDAMCNNSYNDHEHSRCGTFTVISNAEYITKPRTVFNDYNMMLATAEHSNILGIGADPAQTTCTLANCFEGNAAQQLNWWAQQNYAKGSIVWSNSGIMGAVTRACTSDENPDNANTCWTPVQPKGGGQMWHGYQAGDSYMNHSEMPGWVAFNVEDHLFYSGSSTSGIQWGGVNGASTASRSLVYLRESHQVFTFDRVQGNFADRLSMTATGPVTVSGNMASWNTRSGTQTAYWTVLAPSLTLQDMGGYLTVENGNQYSSDWEPYTHVLADGGSPSPGPFQALLEWGPAGFTRSSTTSVASTAGDSFACTHAGPSLVCFRRSWGTTTSTTIPLSGATAVYVMDLTPNTSYSLSAAGAPSSCQSDNAGLCQFAATGSGSAVIGGGSIPPPTTADAPTAVSGTVEGTVVTLTWTPSDTPGSTTNVRRVTGACPSPLAGGTGLASGLTSSSYSDSTSTAGTRYCYYLTASASAGLSDSGPSNPVDITVPAAVTAPPSGLTGGVTANGGRVQ